MASDEFGEIKSIHWKNRIPAALARIPAEVAYVELERLRKLHGGCSDDLLLEVAKSKEHIFHDAFYSLDDVAAAREYRRKVARTLLGAIEIEYVKRPDIGKVRAFEISYRAPSGAPTRTLYTSHKEAMRDPAVRADLLREAIAQLMAWRRRFRGLLEFDNLMCSIEATVAEIVTGDKK